MSSFSDFFNNSAAAGSVVSASSGLLGSLFGLGSSRLNYKYQKKLMKQQYQYALDAWNLENEYNSPASQMARYEEAGLNPNLIYGQISNGNTSSAPSLDSSILPSSSSGAVALDNFSKALSPSNVLSNIVSLQNIKQNAENFQMSQHQDEYIRAQTEQKQAQVISAWLRADYDLATQQSKIEASNLAPSIKKAQLDLINEQREYYNHKIDNVDASTNLINVKAEGQSIQNQFLKGTLDVRIASEQMMLRLRELEVNYLDSTFLARVGITNQQLVGYILDNYDKFCRDQYSSGYYKTQYDIMKSNAKIASSNALWVNSRNKYTVENMANQASKSGYESQFYGRRAKFGYSPSGYSGAFGSPVTFVLDAMSSVGDMLGL